MRVIILSRYPRFDRLDWKRHTAARLLADGHELLLLYSRSSIRDHIEFLAHERALRDRLRSQMRLAGGSTSGARSIRVTLASWARQRAVELAFHSRLDEDGARRAISRWRPDAAVLLGADLVPGPLLTMFPRGVVNAHFGLLPKYRGMNVAEWSVYNDDPVGVSVHFVDPGVDTGSVIRRDLIPVNRGDTLLTIRERQRQVSAAILPEIVSQLGGRQLEATPQRLEAGRQYYRMHPRMLRYVEYKLASHLYALTDVVPDPTPSAPHGELG